MSDQNGPACYVDTPWLSPDEREAMTPAELEAARAVLGIYIATQDELARLRRIERAARALLDGVTWQAAVEPSHPAVGEGLRMVLWLRRTDLTELRAALAADKEATER